MKRHRALVVDDDRAVRSLVKAVFERGGLDVVTAENGGEAIGQLGSRQFDVVILDLMMPKLDGFGVIDYLSRADPASLRRVIVVSAALKVALDDRIFGFVAKPFCIDTLVAVALACASSSGQHAASVDVGTMAALETWR